MACVYSVRVSVEQLVVCSKVWCVQKSVGLLVILMNKVDLGAGGIAICNIISVSEICQHSYLKKSSMMLIVGIFKWYSHVT